MVAAHQKQTDVTVPCSFCGGKGTDPFGILSWRSTCHVCGGKGVVHVPASHVPCPHCEGTGAIKTFSCMVCKGYGFIAGPPEPNVVCPTCHGNGDDISISALACLICQGHGRLSVQGLVP
jgi:DnaJ-class molecular chaperone